MDRRAAAHAAGMKALKLMERFERERRRKNEEEARALGFPSWDEYEQQQKEEWRLSDEKYQKLLDEKCIRLGKTREELYAEDPQRNISDRWSPQCDCKDHPIPLFCPEELVEYRSQDLMMFLEDQKRLHIDDLKIAPEDKSRRLDEGILERAWAFQSQDTSLDLPIWAKADPVLQKIISARSLSPASSVDSTSYRSQASSMTAVEIEEDAAMSDTTVEDATNVELYTKVDLDSPGLTLEKILQRDVLMIPDESGFQSPRSSTQERSVSLEHDGAGLRKIRQRPYQTKKSSGNTRIQKIVPKPARGTRSRRLSKFYELDKNGVATVLLIG